jgi:hypothetical protein
VVLVVYPVIHATVKTVIDKRRLMRRLMLLPPAPPSLCPRCGGIQQTVGAYWMWCGRPDPATGDRPHGDYYCATCTQCGSRKAKWDDDATYVPSDEEWRFWVHELGRSHPDGG